MRGNIWIYLILIVGFSLSGQETGTVFALFYAIMLPVNAIAMDERCRFDRLLGMMPVTSMHNVLCKYMLTYICMGLSLLLGIVRGIYDAHAMAVMELLLPGLAVGLLAQAAMLMMIFRFGVEKGRVIYMASIVGMAALLGALGALAEAKAVTLSLAAGATVFGIALALNVGSIFLSQRMVDRRMMA